MKVRSISPNRVMWPGMPGVYVGASLTKAADGSIVAEFSDKAIDLGADLFKKSPHDYAYFVKKVKEGELEAADDEMAKAAGMKPASAAKPAKSPSVAPPAVTK